MKAEELRIGNWLLGYDNKPFRWGYEHFAQLDYADVDEIAKSGIELTEGILLKCGFEEVYVGFEHQKTAFWISDDFKEINYIQPAYNFEVKYLHELQNLFFAITKEELEVKL